MNELYYYFSQDKNLFYYSCDMVRIGFELYSDKNCLLEFEKYFNHILRTDITIYPINTRDFKYKNLLTIKYEHGGILSMGYCFNGVSGDDKYKGFIEFNPNKCFMDEQIKKDIHLIKMCSWNYEIKRWDLAIDIPLARECISMAKDKRKYEMVMNSKSDKTEYLGERNSVGRVKLYNKSIERKLDYDLTRLEITLDNVDDLDELTYRLREPELYKFDLQKEINFSDLSQTQKVLVECICDSENPLYYFGKLDKRMKSKLRPFICRDEYRLKTDFHCVVDIMNFIRKEILFYPVDEKGNIIYNSRRFMKGEK